jgi:uncharacterized protein YndB with AHSA1/START domain
MAMESFEVSRVIPVEPQRLYKAWLDPDEHSAFTGRKAGINPDGKFTAYDGYIEARTVDSQPARRIVQSWRTTEFPPGSPESRVEILFDSTQDGTRITLRHSDIPEGQAEQYKKGWDEFYFEPMTRYYGGNALTAASRALSNAAERASEAVTSAGEQAGEALEAAGQRASETLQSLSKQATKAATAVRTLVKKAQQTVTRKAKPAKAKKTLMAKPKKKPAKAPAKKKAKLVAKGKLKAKAAPKGKGRAKAKAPAKKKARAKKGRR